MAFSDEKLRKNAAREHFSTKIFAVRYDPSNNEREKKFAVSVVHLRYPKGTYLDANENARSIAESAPVLDVCGRPRLRARTSLCAFLLKREKK